jgi:hypothetical protein
MNNNQTPKDNYPQVNNDQNQIKQPATALVPTPAPVTQQGQQQPPQYQINPNSILPPNAPNNFNNQVPNFPPQQGFNLPPYSQPGVPQQQGQGFPVNNGYPQGNMYPNIDPHQNYNQYNPPHGNFNPQNNGQNTMGYNQQNPYGQPNPYSQPNPYGQSSPYSQSNQYNQDMQAPQQGSNQNMMLKNLISRYSDEIFQKYDSNRSGFLDIKEIYPSVCELFGLCGIPNPEYPRVLAIMQSFDKDRNGLIDMTEFRNLMLKMNGF